MRMTELRDRFSAFPGNTRVAFIVGGTVVTPSFEKVMHDGQDAMHIVLPLPAEHVTEHEKVVADLEATMAALMIANARIAELEAAAAEAKAAAKPRKPKEE